MENDIAKILISKRAIASKVKKMAQKINADFSGKPLTVICLSNGAIIFAADLIRQINIPLQFDTISVSSYRGNKSSGVVKLDKGLKLCIKNRHIIIVDDILDTGHTLKKVIEEISKDEPKAIYTAVLLNKSARREVEIAADYCGFDIEDYFVVGYGLDFNEAYRNLPYIGILKNEIYQS